MRISKTTMGASIHVIRGLLLGLAMLFFLSAAPTPASAFVFNGFDLMDMETWPIWRTQLRVETCGDKYSGTDDNVWVSLKWGTGKFYLDHGGDDREKNDVNTYDLISSKVSKFEDINMLFIMKEGNDAWCIKKIELLANNREQPVFSQSYPNGKWIDSYSDGYTPYVFLYSGNLRADAGWNSAGLLLPPTFLGHDDVENIIESIIGDKLTGEDLYWGKKHGPYVETWHQSSDNLQTVHVDLDLAYSIDYWFDPEVDVDFDLEFSCVPKNDGSGKNELNLDIHSIVVDIDGNDWMDWLTFGIQTIIVEAIESSVNSDLGNTSMNVLQGIAMKCPDVEVQDNGDVEFQINFF